MNGGCGAAHAAVVVPQGPFKELAKQQAALPEEQRIKQPQNVGFPLTDDEWKAIDATHPVIRTVRGRGRRSGCCFSPLPALDPCFPAHGGATRPGGHRQQHTHALACATWGVTRAHAPQARWAA